MTDQETDLPAGGELAPAPEPVERPVSELDSIIASALDKSEETATKELGEASRDERGRFAKAEADKAAASTPPTDQLLQPVELQPLKAPDRWSAADKAEFATLPPNAQKILLARHEAMEADHTRKTQEISGVRNQAEPLLKALAPHKDYLDEMARQYGVSAETLISQLVNVERAFRRGAPQQKAAALATIVQDYGLHAFIQGGGAPQVALPPAVSQLSQSLSQVTKKLEHLEKFQNDQVNSQVLSEIDAFKQATDEKGQLLHPYYSELEGQIGYLLASEKANSLEDAYKMASAPIAKALEAHGGALQAQGDKARQDAIEKARRAAPVRSGGVTPRGASRPSNLDSIVARALDDAGLV